MLNSQNFVSIGSKDDRIDIRSRIHMKTDLIRHKIETELVEDWKGMAFNSIRLLRHPENPQLILKCMYEWYRFNVAFITPEPFDFYRL
ncbi:hypothetical protein CAEBREN_09560 [Caenorhabditis brenneri]|uniref:Uncharacterized protein n=1 Tax=Caenorhabditis brenneri TaxID=135651 RepID=G0MN57_CAEBE|nr:hypothetical protein CAEBREN_09560 [Caenorhabditis brenneri]